MSLLMRRETTTAHTTTCLWRTGRRISDTRRSRDPHRVTWTREGADAVVNEMRKKTCTCVSDSEAGFEATRWGRRRSGVAGLSPLTCGRYSVAVSRCVRGQASGGGEE